MPYTPAAVSTVLRSQLKLIGAAEAAAPEDADLVCYINCGDDDLLPGTKQIEAVRALLNAGRPVALVDSSANFAPAELLLPKLLNSGVPVNRIAAYAGWNTFSNSSGTALAQGLIFAGRLRELQKSGGSEAQYASLYADNLSFTAERILEDYYYQKLLHPSLRHDLEVQGIDPTDLSAAAKQQTTEEIQSRIALDAFLLRRASFCFSFSFVGTTTLMRTSWSPRRPPRRLGIPLPFKRSTLPGCVPSGIFIVT